jgi:glycosyltransferase involved in cell wall biosynthesis
MLRRTTARERWIEIGTAGYADLSHALRQATVLSIPHPPGAYHDIALPVKLLDSMAAGRPLVVTPRLEVRALVERHDVGLVAGGETVDDLADALRTLVTDADRARILGERARQVAVEHFDWAVVGERVADAVLEREGGARVSPNAAA